MGERRVVVPWARALSRLIKSRRAVRLRRDFGQFLRAVKAHALIHRHHRDRDEMGRIVATIDVPDDGEAGAARVQGDYEAIRDLFGDIMAEASETRISERVRETVDGGRGACNRHPPSKDLSGNILTSEGVRIDAIANALRVDRSVAQRRLRQAERKGFIFNLEKRPNPRPSYYRTLPAASDALGIPPADRRRR